MKTRRDFYLFMRTLNLLPSWLSKKTCQKFYRWIHIKIKPTIYYFKTHLAIRSNRKRNGTDLVWMRPMDCFQKSKYEYWIAYHSTKFSIIHLSFDRLANFGLSTFVLFILGCPCVSLSYKGFFPSLTFWEK